MRRVGYTLKVNSFLSEVRHLTTVIANRTVAHPAVFYGSSSIRMWTTLSKDLGRSDVLNTGFGGSTLEACVVMFERLVVAAEPRSVVLYAGENDLGEGRSPEEVLESFRDLARKARALIPGTPVSFISIKPSPFRASLIGLVRQTNALIMDDISDLDDFSYIDVFYEMLDHNGYARADLFLEDGLHMNASGYRLWTEIVRQHRHLIFD